MAFSDLEDGAFRRRRGSLGVCKATVYDRYRSGEFTPGKTAQMARNDKKRRRKPLGLPGKDWTPTL